jgi:hypothetical protein
MAVTWQVAYLPNDEDKMRTLIVILIGLSIFFARREKRDVISGFPEKEAVKWSPSAGTVIALVIAALLFVSAYIGSKSLLKRPAVIAAKYTLIRRQGVEEAFRVYLISEDA